MFTPIRFSLPTFKACSVTALCLFLATANTAQAKDCLPVNGLSFERVSSDYLLAVKDGQNIAFIKVCGELPIKLGLFRFFSPNLCDSGTESRFQIDGDLLTVCGIEMFPGVR